jgi:DNA replication ATP-dependent helicase Dna2
MPWSTELCGPLCPCWRSFSITTTGMGLLSPNVFFAHNLSWHQVRNPRARKGGLDVSLFRRLSETHPHAVIDLNEQYRMNEDIMLLSNQLIYGDRLRCGSDAVAKRRTRLSKQLNIEQLHKGSLCPQNLCWIQQLLDEKYDTLSTLSYQMVD